MKNTKKEKILNEILLNIDPEESIRDIMAKGYQDMSNINLQIAEEFLQLEGNEVYEMGGKKKENTA